MKHSINSPLIVFGRDPIATYPLLVAIAQRRLRQQKRQQQILRMKKAIASLFTFNR